MDLDPEGIFRDDSDEDDDNVQEREANKEMVVYLVDASPKMFTPAKAKKNLQDLAGVYVYNVGDRDPLDRPTAKLIKDFSCIEDSFMDNIGSRYGITAGSRENTLYNALWVAQALLRKGSVKTISKRILIFTNEDNPFGAITGAVKTDMIRTTVQRAKDAQDLGLSIELLPSRPDEEFNMSLFYADLIGLDGDEITEYLPSAGTITWLDSLSNIPLKTERSFICNDTGALLQDPQMRFQMYNEFALAFYGNPTRPQLVALVAQEELTSSSGQVESPGMHMIYLPYSDDIRYPEEVHLTSDDAPRATDEQIKKASNLLKRIDLKDFSVSHFANPGLQRHYGILEALALGEDEMPDIKDETLPDEKGLSRPGVVKAIDEFKASVYGENYDQEEAEAASAKASRGDAAKKRKAITDAASLKSAAYDWAELADNGKLKDMTVVELKSYLTAHDLPVSGKKEALISRILTHLGK
nr:unnamed protein product [Digitaria exilis]